MLHRLLMASALVVAAAAPAWADGTGRCPEIPKAEWRQPDELKKKLVDEGWRIRRMEATPTCYEVYAMDPQGKRVEAFFHPKTLERVPKY